ncbi:hypothetical protein [Chitinimonas koreensis]|uniref:hypothetical protein n=1 Tax=Chitinimonas koreensis TaxID=356302 RepID=UPI001654897F|nr:hypothetical protein [Chitinimonas koreensis]QNM94651.1 hypothetical protein H9L41_11875 [Chitinimonas koreensis]
MHAWSGLPPGRALSDTLLIFENYPNSPQPAGEGALRLAAVPAAARAPTSRWRC